MEFDLEPPTVKVSLNDDLAIFSYSRIKTLQRVVNHQLHGPGCGELAVSTPYRFVSCSHRNTRPIGSVENQLEVTDRCTRVVPENDPPRLTDICTGCREQRISE